MFEPHGPNEFRGKEKIGHGKKILCETRYLRCVPEDEDFRIGLAVIILV